MSAAVLLTACGLLGLALLVADTFATVFHAEGRGGPINRRQNRLIWGLVRRLGRRRPAWLSLGAPAMTVVTTLVWVFLLIVSFACVYHPWIETFLVSPGRLGTPWVETLYYSGYTASTLGFGDLVPDHGALRLLAPVQAFLGFGLLSVSVTYLLSIYREVVGVHTLAASIGGYFPEGVEPVVRGLEGRRAEALVRWAERVDSDLQHALQAHFHYPILHYFRPTDEQRAILWELRHLLDLRDIARDEAAGAHPELAGHPSLLSLGRTVESYVRMIDEHFVPPGIEGRGTAEEPDPVRRAYRRALRYMELDR